MADNSGVDTLESPTRKIVVEAERESSRRYWKESREILAEVFGNRKEVSEDDIFGYLQSAAKFELSHTDPKDQAVYLKNLNLLQDSRTRKRSKVLADFIRGEMASVRGEIKSSENQSAHPGGGQLTTAQLINELSALNYALMTYFPQKN